MTRKPGVILFFLALLCISACKSHREVISVSNQQYTIGAGADTLQNAQLLQLTQVYRDSLNRAMNTPLIYNKIAMTKELPEGNLGNFCSDIWLKAAREICNDKQLPLPEMAVFNHGGLRSSLPAGVLTTRNLFELMPFENELVVCELDTQMKDSLLTTIARKGGAPIAGFRLQLANGKATYAPWKAATLNGKFYVVTSDYLANGNDNFMVFKSGNITSLHVKLREVLIEEIKNLKRLQDTIAIEKDGRITQQ